MSDNIPEILVAEGPLKGGRYSVPEVGLRLGRSSTCEISIPDPALSRNHCLFEVRDGMLWVTDLASANGTFVNDEQLGADSKALAPGDSVIAGEPVLVHVEPGADLPPQTPSAPKIDLGFGRQDDDGGGKAAPMRLVLWAVAALAVVGAAVLIATSSGEAEEGPAPQAAPEAESNADVNSSAEGI